MWIGQSSQVIPRPFCPRRGQTDILQGSGCGEDHGFPPGVRITHPRGLSVVSSSAVCCGEKNVTRRSPARLIHVEESQQFRQEYLKPVPSSLLNKIQVKARRSPMMPRRSTVTNLFIVRFFIFDIFSSNEYYEHGVVVFSFDEPGPGDNPGHLNFLDNQERVQEMSPSRKKNWTRKTFLIQPRSHKMILQKTLSMLPKKLRSQ